MEEGMCQDMAIDLDFSISSSSSDLKIRRSFTRNIHLLHSNEESNALKMKRLKKSYRTSSLHHSFQGIL
ncbi:hypothetical protein MRB53_007555 [Persea americana]|uniref:Uncharacterized protein n=1 Tax=Persea americana TaxID=3435 RepID=A0ACC2MJ92_PERAE|nr:hypothetical protein MRB53_007555 [Persea americana]